MNILFLFLHKKCMKQFVDNVRPGGHRAEAALLHGRQKGCFVIICRRFCPPFINFYRPHGFCHTFLHFRKKLLTDIVLRFILDNVFIGRLPSRLFHPPAFCREDFPAADAFQRRLFVFTRRIEYRRKPPDHQIIDFPLIAGHVLQLDKLLRRYNGMMIRYLTVIDKTLIDTNRLNRQFPHDFPVGSDTAGFKTLL